MKPMQDKVGKFNEEREWGGVNELKDSLLNMNEEIGELWHLIKWIDVEKQKQILSNNKEEVGNFIGDMQYLLMKIAYMCDIDSEAELQKVLDEYEKRFPIEKVKIFKHGNLKAGGYDDKHGIN